jgi:hypothetical protein
MGNLKDSSVSLSIETKNTLLWVDEAERRLADLRAGKAREYPANEVFRSIRTTLAGLDDKQIDFIDFRMQEK